ncbi:MAG: DMT family transporter [Clostridiales bacterium]|nr:DMT family transporter [Clostridiales bacterium]
MKDNHKTEEKNQALRGTILTLAGGTLWGFSGTCGQFLLQTKGLTSNWLVPIRLFCAGLILVLICLLREGAGAFAIWKKDAAGILVFAILGMSMCQYTYFSAIGASNAGTATVLQYIGPVLIMIILSLRNRRMPKASELAAVALAVLGTFLLATHGTPGTMALSGEALFWGLLSAVALAIYTMQPISLLNRYGSAVVTGWGMLVGGIVLGLLFRPWSLSAEIDTTVIIGMGVIILFGTVTAFTAYLEGVRCVGPKKGSLFASIEPVSATFFSVIWMKASFVWIDFVGFACVLSTIFLLAADKEDGSGKD